MKKLKLLSLAGIASIALAHAGWAAGHGGGGGGFGGGGFHGGGFGGGGFHGGGFRGGGNFSSMRGGHTFARGGPDTWGGPNWRDHHHRNDVFFGDFGFPRWWDWGYPYGYYGYGYYPYDYYGYGGYGYDNGSSIAQMQRQLAQAGYYHGAIDGIMGPATRRAIRAYERDK